jgi:hypothetical protein
MGSPVNLKKTLPFYSQAGLVTILLSETLMWLRIEPFWSWHTPIAWTGYILFVDGLVLARRGTSWLTDAPREFSLLALLSIPLWLVFEFYNLFIRNWYYINLPESLFWRTLGYGWSFATIWPAIFETAELVATFRASSTADATGPTPQPAANSAHFASRLSSLGWISIAAGAIMLIWPLVLPSPYLAAPVWLGFILLLDPVNAWRHAEAIGTRWLARRAAESYRANPVSNRGGKDRLINLCVAGLVCGVFWEFWNYWARTKWIYTVPILPDWKVFEMPLPGYLGFPAFAVECFTMYVAVRQWIWRGSKRPVGLLTSLR